jgi:ribosomal protein RSM22 (predicted rRNA methylase)
VLPPALCAGATLRQAVIDRSRRYTSGRTWSADDAGDAVNARDAKHPASPIAVPLVGREHSADLAAHALFFAPADAAKIMIPLAELHGRGLLPRGPLRVLDVGAGPGAMTLGALDFLHRAGHDARARISVHAVDRDRDALRIYRGAVTELGQHLGLDVEVTTEHVDLARQRVHTPAADLILIGSVLNELDPAQSRALVVEHLGLLAERGSLIIIEPALRETTRALHALRDAVVTGAGAHVFAPCVRQSAPCPALADERDWCHEDRPVRLPERTAKLAATTGLRSHGLKFAYLVLRRDGERLVAEADRAGRVVSQPRKSKGKRECYVCSEAGRSLVRVLKRNRSAANRDFERVRRGDVLIAGTAGAPPVGNLAPAQEIAVSRPAELTGAGMDELADGPEGFADDEEVFAGGPEGFAGGPEGFADGEGPAEREDSRTPGGE